MGVGAGAPGASSACSHRRRDREAHSWSGEGALCTPDNLELGVGAGVEGTRGDLKEEVEEVLDLTNLSINSLLSLVDVN